MDPWDINPNYRLKIWKELLAELRLARHRRIRAARKAARTKAICKSCSA